MQNQNQPLLHMREMLNDIIYIMEGIGCFVHSTIQQFGDAKLLYVPSYFIRGTTQNVVCLEEEEEEACCSQLYKTPYINPC